MIFQTEYSAGFKSGEFGRHKLA